VTKQAPTRKAKKEQTCGKCGMQGHRLDEGCPYPRKKKKTTGRGKDSKPVLLDGWT